jgi:hypothetical protein
MRVLKEFEMAGLEYDSDPHIDESPRRIWLGDYPERTRMPVQKFRSIEEMNKAEPPRSGTDHFERFLRHCARYWAIAPKHYPRGVFKFRSLEEAQKARAEYQLKNP